MNEPRCKCGHYQINHPSDWDCAIAGCECALFELADGNQAATQSSGVNRGSAAQETHLPTVDSEVTERRESSASLPIEWGCESDGSEHRFVLRSDVCDCGLMERAGSAFNHEITIRLVGSGNQSSNAAASGPNEQERSAETSSSLIPSVETLKRRVMGWAGDVCESFKNGNGCGQCRNCGSLERDHEPAKRLRTDVNDLILAVQQQSAQEIERHIERGIELQVVADARYKECIELMKRAEAAESSLAVLKGQQGSTSSETAK